MLPQPLRPSTGRPDLSGPASRAQVVARGMDEGPAGEAERDHREEGLHRPGRALAWSDALDQDRRPPQERGREQEEQPDERDEARLLRRDRFAEPPPFGEGALERPYVRERGERRPASGTEVHERRDFVQAPRAHGDRGLGLAHTLRPGLVRQAHLRPPSYQATPSPDRTPRARPHGPRRVPASLGVGETIRFPPDDPRPNRSAAWALRRPARGSAVTPWGGWQNPRVARRAPHPHGAPALPHTPPPAPPGVRAGASGPVPASRRRALELGALALTVGLQFLFYDVLPGRGAFLLATVVGWVGYLAHRIVRRPEALREYGLARDGLGASAAAAGVILLVGTLVCFAIGSRRGGVTLSRNMLWTALLYPIWGILQQVLVQGVAVRNLARAIPGAVVVLVAGLLFGLVHLPHLALAAATATLGGVFTLVFLRHRNVWPLGVCHGLLGVLFYYWVLGRDPWWEMVSQV